MIKLNVIFGGVGDAVPLSFRNWASVRPAVKLLAQRFRVGFADIYYPDGRYVCAVNCTL